MTQVEERDLGRNGHVVTPAPIALPTSPSIRRWHEQTRELTARLQAELAERERKLEVEAEQIQQLRKALGGLHQLLERFSIEAAPTQTRPWSRRYAACIDCGTTTTPHASHGRCGPCDSRYRRGKHA